jgi:hypothetical protein
VYQRSFAAGERSDAGDHDGSGEPAESDMTSGGRRAP